ncbi:hypothetical protein QNA08_18000 [Chelatococcus sp. SYSU_G07232]|uniref:Uncharacterized protein n=1 Tax=Chelatococcus albus TaxID=3047466 RepID=A0ABT7AL53_9HYPH|nr:hypothetical protein [Chelatococcus sp. SYSU_G07232]MDJ1160108.1 hypothetical protein [Chelatococcus sp. SYSU_G07232]
MPASAGASFVGRLEYRCSIMLTAAIIYVVVSWFVVTSKHR